jgi:hypothetical protein
MIHDCFDAHVQLWRDDETIMLAAVCSTRRLRGGWFPFFHSTNDAIRQSTHLHTGQDKT